MSQTLNDSLDQAIARRLPVQVVPGEVVAVRPAQLECDVQPDNGDAPLLGVALINGIYPALGAQAWVGLIENRRTDTFLIGADPVAHFQLTTEKESLHALLKDLIAEVRQLKFNTNVGATLALITDPAWVLLAARVDKLLLP